MGNHDKKKKKSKDHDHHHHHHHHHHHKRDKREADDSDDDHGSRKRSKAAVEQISKADYMIKNAPFTKWLRKKKNVYFDQLSSERSRELFDEFVEKWNSGDLSSKYYEMPTVHVSHKERTGFKWAFVDKLDKQDKKGLAELEKEVEVSAVTDVLGGSGAALATTAPLSSSTASSGASAAPRRVMGPAAPDPSQLQAYTQQLHQKDRRDYRKQDKEAVEELIGGKATGHERKLEKKMDARAERQAREQSPDVVPGGEAYSSDTIRAEALRQQERAQQRQAEKKDSAKEKLLQHAQREKEKLQELLQLAKATRREGALYQG